VRDVGLPGESASAKTHTLERAMSCPSLLR
jgi:hypothetical protein